MPEQKTDRAEMAKAFEAHYPGWEWLDEDAEATGVQGGYEQRWIDARKWEAAWVAARVLEGQQEQLREATRKALVALEGHDEAANNTGHVPLAVGLLRLALAASPEPEGEGQ